MMQDRPQCVKSTRLEHGKRIAVICMHCPDVKEGTLWAMENGFLDSHGICSTCIPIYHPTIPQELIDKERAKEGIFAC